MGLLEDIKKMTKHKSPLADAAKPPTTPAQTDPRYVELYEDTADDLADVAVGLTRDCKIENLTEKTFRALSPIGLVLRPYKRGLLNKGERVFGIEFPFSVPANYTMAALKKVGVTNPKMENSATEIKFDFPRSLIPDFWEYSRLNGTMIETRDAVHPEYCWPPAIHPFVFAYMCAPHDRPLITAAIRKSVEDGYLEPPKPRTSHSNVHSQLLTYPGAAIQYVREAAKDYGITNVDSASNEIKRIGQRLHDEWV